MVFSCFKEGPWKAKLMSVLIDSSNVLDATWLWHLRLGHVSEKSLDVLRRSEMIDDIHVNVHILFTYLSYFPFKIIDIVYL